MIDIHYFDLPDCTLSELARSGFLRWVGNRLAGLVDHIENRVSAVHSFGSLVAAVAGRSHFAEHHIVAGHRIETFCCQERYRELWVSWTTKSVCALVKLCTTETGFFMEVCDTFKASDPITLILES